jgi:coenzyme F420-reducing hydrogenase alpha subunit
MATSHDLLPPRARRAAEACGIDWPSGNPFQAIVARAIELVAAFEEAARIAGDFSAPLAVPRIDYAPRVGEACHATEAPRGLLYHRYAIGADGLIAAAAIVPPTSQNQARIEADLAAYLPTVLDRDDAEATRRCEHLIRTYDPCISCATHFLRIER